MTSDHVTKQGSSLMRWDAVEAAATAYRLTGWRSPMIGEGMYASPLMAGASDRRVRDLLILVVVGYLLVSRVIDSLSNQRRRVMRARRNLGGLRQKIADTVLTVLLGVAGTLVSAALSKVSAAFSKDEDEGDNGSDDSESHPRPVASQLQDATSP